ncbi:hypothetical protein ONZ45_g15067 [Pleurotus djamor]|nr:hypothetical protein ONZ45_g15067 [Pleurotus djamor]
MPSISSSLLPTTRKRARISDPLSITSSSSRIRLPLSQARKATAPVINARTTSSSFPEPPRKRRRTQRHAAIDSLPTRKSQPEVINLISDEEDDHIPTEDVPERLSPSCVSRLRAQASSSSVLADLTTSRSQCSSSPQKNKVVHSGYNASTEMIEATLRGGEETLSSVMHLLESRESPKVAVRSSPPSAIGSPSKPITISPTSSPAPPENLFGDVETFNADEDEGSPGSRDSPEIAADSDHPSSPLSCQPIRASLTSHGQPSPQVDEVIQASTAIEETLIAVKHLLQPRMDSPSRVPSPSRPIRSSPLPSPEAPVTEARWSPGPIPGSSQPVWSTLDVRASSSPSTSECDTEDQGTSPFFDDEEEVDELESSRQVSPIPHATDDVSMEMDVDGAPDLGTLAAESSPVLHNTSPFEDTAHTISNVRAFILSYLLPRTSP